jgi:hypothetical protein
MEAKLWRPLYTLITSLPHPRRRPKEQFDDRAIVLVLCWAALNHESRVWACDPANWPADLDRPLPSDSTVCRRARRAGVGQLFERAMAAVGDLLDGPAGPPLVKVIDSKPLTVGAYSKDRQAALGRVAAKQFARGYRLHALCHGRHVRRFTIAAMDEHDATHAPPLLAALAGGGYVVADNAYDSNPLHACAAAANHQLVSPPRRCNAGVRDAKHNGAARLRALDVMDSPLTRHAGPDAFGRQLYNCRESVESCFGELSHVGLNYLPAWARGPRRVALWAAAKILIYLVRRAVKQGLMR